jgi:hypothetical protein
MMQTIVSKPMDAYDYALIGFVLIFCVFGVRSGLRKTREQYDEINRLVDERNERAAKRQKRDS